MRSSLAPLLAAVAPVNSCLIRSAENDGRRQQGIVTAGSGGQLVTRKINAMLHVPVELIGGHRKGPLNTVKLNRYSVACLQPVGNR